MIELLLALTISLEQPAPVQQAFDRHAHLLACSGSDCHDKGFLFTLAVACDLQPDVALYRKDSGTRCTAPNGVSFDCEKVIAVASGDMYDIVVNHGIPSQRPAWQHVASNVKDGRVTAPPCGAAPPPPPPPQPTPEPPPQPPPAPPVDLGPVLHALQGLASQLASVDANVRNLMERVEVLVSQNETIAQMLKNPRPMWDRWRLLGSFRLSPEQR